MEFPKNADMKPPGRHDAIREAFYLLVFDKSKRLLNLFFKASKGLNNLEKGGN